MCWILVALLFRLPRKTMYRVPVPIFFSPFYCTVGGVGGTTQSDPMLYLLRTFFEKIIYYNTNLCQLLRQQDTDPNRHNKCSIPYIKTKWIQLDLDQDLKNCLITCTSSTGFICLVADIALGKFDVFLPESIPSSSPITTNPLHHHCEVFSLRLKRN